jgi:hypothetical protein
MMPGDGARVAASGSRQRYVFRPVSGLVDGVLKKDMAEDRLAGSALATSTHLEVGLLRPVDKLTCLGGNAGQVRLVIESLFVCFVCLFASIKLFTVTV